MLLFLIGPGGSGKDTIGNKIIEDGKFRRYVTYTTRPMRDGEVEGETYHFVDEDKFVHMSYESKFIECRIYNTKFGRWRYATPKIDVSKENYIIWGSFEQYLKLKKFFGKDLVCCYLYVEPKVRLNRMFSRIDRFGDLVEAARRFVADYDDYSQIVENEWREMDIIVDNTNRTVDWVVSQIYKNVENIVENVEKSDISKQDFNKLVDKIVGEFDI